MDIPPGVGVRAPRQAAYHSIVQLYGYRAARVPHSRLDAVPRLVAAPGATSETGCMERMEIGKVAVNQGYRYLEGRKKLTLITELFCGCTMVFLRHSYAGRVHFVP